MANREILLYENVKSGTTVWNGFIGGDTECTAPEKPENELWSLFEVVNDNNIHVGWHWEPTKYGRR